MGEHDEIVRFHESLDDLTEEEVAWLKKALETIEGEEKYIPSSFHRDTDEPMDEKAVKEFPKFSWKFDSHMSGRFHEAHWIEFASVANGSAWHVAGLVHDFMKKFRPDGVFQMTWSSAIDDEKTPRGGGGFTIVSAKEIVFETASGILMLLDASEAHEKIEVAVATAPLKRDLETAGRWLLELKDKGAIVEDHQEICDFILKHVPHEDEHDSRRKRKPR
jgi:hypothetical protein